MKLILLPGILLLFSLYARSQVNVELLHQLVAESKSEHSKQTDARTSQAGISTNESLNKVQMTKLKAIDRTIQNRFHTLGLVIDGAETGLQVQTLLVDITNQQEIILRQASRDPALIALALDSETDLADQAHLLTNYAYGLLLSIGDINQMKTSDRILLFHYIVQELSRIAGASRGLAAALLNSNRDFPVKLSNPFAAYINQDLGLAGQIMSNVKISK
jgi:hypothetical protein